MKNNVDIKSAKGFTLIETLVYLALFAIMIGGIVVASYNLFESSDRNQTKAMMQEEKDFLLGKIDLAMSGAQNVTSPSAGSAGTSLALTKYDLSSATVALSGTNMTYNGAILNNSNVKISQLKFIHAYTGAANPESVEAGFTITATTPEGSTISQTASTTVYLRK